MLALAVSLSDKGRGVAEWGRDPASRQDVIAAIIPSPGSSSARSGRQTSQRGPGQNRTWRQNLLLLLSTS